MNLSELAAKLIIRGKDITDGIKKMFGLIQGSCSLLIVTAEGIYAARDRYGYFPLILGQRGKEASAFFAWVGGRLPTEAEWERAGRGDDSRQFPWGDTFDPGAATRETAVPTHRLQPVNTRTVSVPMESSISREASRSGVPTGTTTRTMRRVELRTPRDPSKGRGGYRAAGTG